MAGCSVASKKILPSRMNRLHEGMSYTDVINLLHDKYNFKFNIYCNGTEYMCLSYDVESTYSSYCLLFVNDKLDVVLPEKLINKIWCEYTEKNIELPFQYGPEEFVDEIFSKKTEIQKINFLEIDHESKRENEKSKSEEIGYAISCFPIYSIFLPILVPYAFYEAKMSKEFAEKRISLPLMCGKEEIVKKLGPPFRVMNDFESNYEIWVYKQTRYTVVGIREGQLEWVGQYYNIIKFLSERGIKY